MNAPHEPPPADRASRSPFWACLAVFGLLAVDQGLRLAQLAQERRQLAEARVTLAQNAPRPDELRRLENRLERLSLALLQLSRTNAAAASIVREFKIQWTPASSPPAAAPAASPAPPAR